MEPNKLLPACRKAFTATFISSLNKTIPKTAEALFQRADASYSSGDQTLYLDACHLLSQPETLLALADKELDSLLTRSFQTTYNTFRPRSALSLQGKDLALVDASTLDNELQLNEMTDLFRNEAEEDIRDLNIRIALLFGQDTIKERENPFRPYLLARCLTNAVNGLSGDAKRNAILSLELAHQILEFMTEIYNSVNQHLAKNGVAAELQFKLKRPPLINPADSDLADAAAQSPNGSAPSSPAFSANAQPAAAARQNLPGAGNDMPAIRGMSRGFAARFSGSALASALQASIGGIGQSLGGGTAAKPQFKETDSAQPELLSNASSGMNDAAGSAESGGNAGSGDSGSAMQLMQAANEATQKIGHLFNTVRQIALSIGQNGKAASARTAGMAPSPLAQAAFGAASASAATSHEMSADYAGYSSLDAAAYAGAARLAAGQRNELTSADPQMFSWLPENQQLGSALRDFFSGSGGSLRPGSGLTGLPTGRPAQSASGTPPARPALAPQEQFSNQDANGNISHFSQVDTLSDQPVAPGETAEAPAGSDQLTVPLSERNGIVHAVHQLQMRLATPVEQMFDASGVIRNLILEQRQSLNEMTSDVDEQMTIDVVAMLFEFILSDPQVPAEIRAQLGRLQFLVLKIALREPTLLTQKGHPARMLINRIGSISLGLKKIDPTGVHIADEICRIVETLLQDDQENSQLFSKMLDELDAFIAKELRDSDQRVANAAVSLEETQHRTLRLLHIQAQFQEVTQQLSIDPFLKDFLHLHWMAAIELAERDDGKRGLRYRLLVPDLLWSIVPKTAGEDKTQLFALLPIILNTIREGLASLKWDNQQQQTLLDWLVDAHTAALRGAQINGETASLPQIHDHFHRFAYANTDTPAGGQQEAESTETQRLLSEAIRDLDLKVELLDQLVEHDLAGLPEPQSATADAAMSPEAIRERLRIGISIELKLGVRPTTGRLNWIDDYMNQLMLTLEGSQQPSLISVRMFRRMIAHGRVRFLEVEPLFERAVQALLTTADAVDTPAPL